MPQASQFFVQREHLLNDSPYWFVEVAGGWGTEKAEHWLCKFLKRTGEDNGFYGPGAKRKAERLLRMITEELAVGEDEKCSRCPTTKPEPCPNCPLK